MDDPIVGENRQSQVNEQLSLVKKRVTILNEKADELAGRLLAVLTDGRPAAGEGLKEKTLVPLAHQIRAVEIDLTGLEYKLNEILDRLEL